MTCGQYTATLQPASADTFKATHIKHENCLCKLPASFCFVMNYDTKNVFGYQRENT